MSAPWRGQIVLYREVAGGRAVCCIVSEESPIELTYLGPTRPQDSLVHGQVVGGSNPQYLDADNGGGHIFFDANPGMAAFLPTTPAQLATAAIAPSAADVGSETTPESEAVSETPAEDAEAPTSATPAASTPDAAPAASTEQQVPASGEAAPAEPSTEG